MDRLTQTSSFEELGSYNRMFFCQRWLTLVFALCSTNPDDMHDTITAGVYFCNGYAKPNTVEARRPKSPNCIPPRYHYCFVPRGREELHSLQQSVSLMSSEGPMPDKVALLPGSDTIWITVLRHPHDRTLSAYHYFIKVQDTPRKRKGGDAHGHLPGACGNFYVRVSLSRIRWIHQYSGPLSATRSKH